MTVVDSDGRGLAARLWEANRDLAMVALGDRFVRGLADGSLPAESFKAYVAQDAFFLEAFARAYALALARSPDRHGLETVHALFTGVLDELRLHARYALGVDLTRVEPPPWPTPFSCWQRPASAPSARGARSGCAAYVSQPGTLP